MSIHGSIAGWAAIGLSQLKQFAQNPRNVIQTAALIGTIRLGFCFAPSMSEIKTYFNPEPICTQNTFLGFPYGDPVCVTPEISFQKHIEQLKDIDSSFLVASLAALAIPPAIAFIKNRYLKKQTPPDKNEPPASAPHPKKHEGEGLVYNIGEMGDLALAITNPNSASPTLFFRKDDTVTQFNLSQVSPAVLSENIRKLLGDQTFYREFGGIIHENLSKNGDSISLVRKILSTLKVEPPSKEERLLLPAPPQNEAQIPQE